MTTRVNTRNPDSNAFAGLRPRQAVQTVKPTAEAPQDRSVSRAFSCADVRQSNIAWMFSAYEKRDSSNFKGSTEVVLAQCSSVLRIVADLETLSDRADNSVRASRLTSGQDVADAVSMVADMVDAVRAMALNAEDEEGS